MIENGSFAISILLWHDMMICLGGGGVLGRRRMGPIGVGRGGGRGVSINICLKIFFPNLLFAY